MAVIAVIGGTGREGFGLALRWRRAGYQVIIGSRDEEKARRAAQEAGASGARNADAAEQADVVVVAVPFHAQQATLEGLRPVARGKVVVDTTVPLKTLRPPALWELPEGSAAQRAQALLPDARVVAAFHTVSAVKLTSGATLDEDTLVCGDDPAARALVSSLAAGIGLRPVDAGPLSQAPLLESLACLVIALNQRHRRPSIGVRFQGL